MPYIKQKTSTETQVQMQAWAQIGVAAAEQIYSGPGRGKEKKRYVETFLKSKGYSVDLDTISALIESQVNDLWQVKKEGVE